MRRLKIHDSESMKIAILDKILRSEESRYDCRLQGNFLVCSGCSCTEVAELMGQSRRTVQYWVRRFGQSGFAG